MRNKKIIISMSLVFLANAIAASGWFYLFSSVSEQRREVDGIRRELAAVERDFRGSRSLELLLDDIQDEKKKMDEAFLNKGNLIRFIEQLE